MPKHPKGKVEREDSCEGISNRDKCRRKVNMCAEYWQLYFSVMKVHVPRRNEENMRRTRDVRREYLAGLSALTLLLVMIGMLLNPFSFISHAQGQGKVSVRSATIRRDADVNSDAVGSAAQDTAVTITSEVTGSDGKVWYQVDVNGTQGYIRSDLIQKTESADANAGAAVTIAPTVAVTEVQPQSATVTSSQSVRVRSDASTSSQIITTVQNGTVLTVTGQATGADEKVWYRVSFVADNTEITGFIRSDYVPVSAELVPVQPDVPAEGTGEAPLPEEPVPTEPVVEEKPWDTELDGTDGKWYLIDRAASGRYDIDELFTTMKTNVENYNETLKEVKSQKIVIIILLVLLVVAILTATLLFMKVREVTDEAYFSAVEKETLRERNTSRISGNVKRSAQDGEPEKASRPQGKPVQKPQGAAQGKPVQGKPTQIRPAGQGQPRSNARPQEVAPQRPAQSQAMTAQKAQGTVKAAAARAAMQDGAAAPKPTVQPKKPIPQKTEEPNPSWKSKNFMTDEDDEFEFEFLNWDGDDNE